MVSHVGYYIWRVSMSAVPTLVVGLGPSGSGPVLRGESSPGILTAMPPVDIPPGHSDWGWGLGWVTGLGTGYSYIPVLTPS